MLVFYLCSDILNSTINIKLKGNNQLLYFHIKANISTFFPIFKKIFLKKIKNVR